MHKRFTRFVDSLDDKYRELIAMTPTTLDNLHGTPTGGVYLFSEGDSNLYVGRTKVKIATRVKAHVRAAPDCPFAFRLAREATGNTSASYTGIGTRKQLLKTPSFSKAYQRAKSRIRMMQVRYVHEPDPIKQALLEIYVSVVLKTKYNDFDTH